MRNLLAKQKALGDIFDRINSKFEKSVPLFKFSPPPIQVQYSGLESKKFSTGLIIRTYPHLSDEHNKRFDLHISADMAYEFVKQALKEGFMSVNFHKQSYGSDNIDGISSEMIVLSGRLVKQK